MRHAATALLVLMVAACGTEVSDGPAAPVTSTTVDTGPVTTLDDDPAASVQEQAVADLVRRLTVETEDITVTSVDAVTWPNGSLGCPQPGEMYTQALVDGYRVVLSHGERVYLYHSGSDQAPFLCPSEEKDGGYDFLPPPGYDAR